ncbi:RecQ family ATP-dependent DNA helicase [Bifidobacterium adolescentis]|uniref:RecQ family ATP-dependent DNA helicase n=1 Tax=Bifidobacterium adolescentis TaxID=1680 RepID=UPI00069969DF|nr:ATP-dependent DNA helicase RecQ [Bifidobacterium adolescentis]
MMEVDYLDMRTGGLCRGELKDYSKAALSQLDKAYGYKSFRPGQLEAVNSILNRHDLIAVMPTGSGKSVCYQLPALRDGSFTVVVSPLRALMRDQVQALQARGVAAALIDSGVTPKQRQSIYAMAHGGGLRILYVAPERLFADDFLFFSQSTRIDLIAVDEAHCVLQWGHDFRPNYLKIGEFIAGLPTRPVVAAFTATATRVQVPEIARNLGLVQPARIGTGFDRPNIRFDALKLKPSARKQFILDWVDGHEGSGIIYCNTIKDCDSWADRLARHGVDAAAFYAPLTDKDKARIQDGFLAGSPRVICATTAFGMGVDKPDVRWVVNNGPCESLEAFYQEAGRAGRDGRPARSVVLWTDSDFINWRYRLQDHAGGALDDPELKERAERAALGRLDAMQQYCETDECLRRVLLDYFGEDQDRKHCDNCGNCTYVADCDVDPQELRRKSRSTRARCGGKTGKGRKTAKHAEGETEKEPQPYEPKPEDKAIVSFVAGRQKLLGRGFGDRKTILSLQGGTGEDIDDQGLDQVDGYGELAGTDEQTIKDRIKTLVAADLLKRGIYHTLLDGKETES